MVGWSLSPPRRCAPAAARAPATQLNRDFSCVSVRLLTMQRGFNRVLKPNRVRVPRAHLLARAVAARRPRGRQLRQQLLHLAQGGGCCQSSFSTWRREEAAVSTADRSSCTGGCALWSTEGQSRVCSRLLPTLVRGAFHRLGIWVLLHLGSHVGCVQHQPGWRVWVKVRGKQTQGSSKSGS